MNCFDPLSTHPDASRRAIVRSAPASLPECASVSAQAPSILPSASGGRNSRFCASLANIKRCATHSPLCAATESAIDGSIRASSSMQMQYSTADMPAPPYSSGRWMPVSPTEASFGHNETGNACASSHSMTCGRSSASANSRTVRRKSSWSLVGRKSIW
jgi:hypothetical protein